MYDFNPFAKSKSGFQFLIQNRKDFPLRKRLLLIFFFVAFGLFQVDQKMEGSDIRCNIECDIKIVWREWKEKREIENENQSDKLWLVLNTQMRRGHVAPRTTIIETIIRKFDTHSKYSKNFYFLKRNE